MKTGQIFAACTTLVILFTAAGVARSASPYTFAGLGLPAGANSSTVTGISADGSTVIGTSSNVSVTAPFRWTASSGFQSFATPPGASASFTPNAVSGDGQFIIGTVEVVGAPFDRAYRWSSRGGYQLLSSTLSETAHGAAISRDGTIAAGSVSDGTGSNGLFTWTQAGGLSGKGAGGVYDNYQITPTSMSADGSVIIGHDHHFVIPDFQPTIVTDTGFRYTAATGIVDFHYSFDTRQGGYPLATNGAGNAFVGIGPDGTPYAWTFNDLTGHSLGAFAGKASGISDDSRTIVGYSSASNSAQIWLNGSVSSTSLQNFLLDNGVSNLSGWTLQNAIGISADGRTIVGVGTDPSGHTEGWIATVPEPSTIALAASLTLAIAAFRVGPVCARLR